VFLDGQTFEEFILTGEQVGERHCSWSRTGVRALFVEANFWTSRSPSTWP